MANTHTSLSALFTDIADAIREKTGGTGTIVADNFPTSIRNMKIGFPNGTEWTVTNADTGITDVIYLNGLYFAGGLGENTNSGKSGIYCSEDGKNWILTNAPAKNGASFQYINGVYVLGFRSNGGLYYSTDGIEWKQSNITDLTLNSYYNALIYYNGLLLASLNTGGSDYGVYYSEDGKTWVSTGHKLGYNSYFINNGNLCISSNDMNTLKGIYYSEDGKVWLQSNITKGVFQIISYGGLLVAGAKNSNNNPGIFYSLDGKIWTQSNISSGVFEYIFFKNNMWFASSSSGGLYYSKDGKNWTKSNISESVRSIDYGNGLFVAGGKSIYYSTDGKTWSVSNITSEKNPWYVTYKNRVWVTTQTSTSLSETFKNVLYSIDGKSWIESNISEFGVAKVSYVNDMWFVGFSRKQGLGTYYYELYYSVTWEPEE